MILCFESNGGKINLSCDIDYAPHEFIPPVPINVYWDGLTVQWLRYVLGLMAQNYGKNLEILQGTSSRPQSSHVLEQLWMVKA